MVSNDLIGIFPGKPSVFNTPIINFKKKIDDSFIQKLDKFIKNSTKNLADVGLKKTVIGLSGGIDSAVAATLATKALGKNAHAVIINFEASDAIHTTEFCKKLADTIGIQSQIISGEEILQQHLKLLPKNNDLARLHLRSRLINLMIFHFADQIGASVIDTTDKSERILGRHAECFYGHYAPLFNLYKSELFDIADFLKLPKEVTIQSGCPELDDLDAFGVPWTDLDPVLFLLFEKKMAPEEISKKYLIDENWLKTLKKRIKNQPIRLTTRKNEK